MGLRLFQDIDPTHTIGVSRSKCAFTLILFLHAALTWRRHQHWRAALTRRGLAPPGWYRIHQHEYGAMGQGVQPAICTSSCPSLHNANTFPLCSVMHGRFEDITRVDLILTEPSQMIRSSREGCATV